MSIDTYRELTALNLFPFLNTGLRFAVFHTPGKFLVS
jgi:hypothetical protein